jgi:hypothetical protein
VPEHGPHDLTIDLIEGKEPPWGPIYNLSAKELETLRDYLDENLARNWIRPSTSSAGAPVFFVPKKDGSLRLCVDYRGLNQISRKNRYPLPLISESIDRLSGAKFYTKLDIRDAYHRVRVAEGKEWKTAFRTRYGHYEYTVMPFGLANAPAAFQSYINATLRPYLDVFVIAYLDDIVIYSNTAEEHREHVRTVLKVLLKAGLYLKLRKCEFNAKEIGFMGFVITPEEVRMERDRIATIEEWPMPESHRDIQVFLGFANFYRRFIKGFSRIVRPMTAMLRGGKEGKIFGPFVPTTEMKEAFWRLQSEFTKAPVLAHFDYERPIRLETDASGYAIAGIISQPAAGPTSGEGGERVKDRDWHLVAFWSRTMADPERNYSVGDQEMLAIVEACRHWRHYLEGSKYPVRVLTDHQNLQGFMKNKPLRGRLGRWWETLSGYDLEIVYRTGKTNSADGLSRRPDYKAAAEAADSDKQANETREEVVRINAAQRLGPWGQRLAATVAGRLPVAAQGSPRNAHRLLATLIREEEAEGEKDLLPSMCEVIKGLLGQDKTV